MTCMIIDDEPLARDEMQYLIAQHSDLNLVGSFANPARALEFLHHHAVDLVFLDIEMPMRNGLEVARVIGRQALVIFTTAYPQYALKGFELDVVDYLLKPIDSNRLIRAIEKAKRLKGLASPSHPTEQVSPVDTILIRSDRRYQKVDINQITHIEGLKDYVVIHEQNQQLITAMNLKNMQKRLPADRFLRVSKSYIVNLDHIEAFDSTHIQLNGKEIPIGAVYRDEFLKRQLRNEPDQEDPAG